MKSNYKRIGDYIRVVDERNIDLRVKNLLGLSISKEFVPSVANTVGTDMSKYKVVKKNQFVCSTMQVRRDKKMPVALLQHIDEGIISPAYYVFEVIDENILLPEYLMMWFSREEFDREACFYAVGGVRGSLEWEDFCDMKLAIPSIEMQREILREYNVILNRIKLNENMIEKLEMLVQLIYKKIFINTNQGYDKIKFKEIAIPQKGKNITREKAIDGPYPVVAGGILPSCYHNKYNTNKPVVTISASGANAGYVNLYHTEVWSSDSSFIDNTISKYVYFCYVFLKINQEKITSMQEGTGQPHIYPEHLLELDMKKYPEEMIEEFENVATAIFNRISNCLRENISLKNMSEICKVKITNMGE